MRVLHLLITVGAAALAGTAALSQTVTTTTHTTHVVSTRSAASSSGHRYRPVYHRRVAYSSRRHAGSRGYSNRVASRTETTTTVTRTVQHPERYDYNRPDPSYGGYYADRYYRDSPQYHERVLSENDRVYAGENGRYYCRRPDGTTGLIVGGAAGGILGNVLTSGHSETLGTILGGAAGALAGRAVERNSVRCR